MQKDLLEWSGEVLAVLDALVPNPRFGPLLPTTKERHSFKVFPKTYGKSDNGIASTVSELVPPKTHLIRNGRIQHRRNKQFYRRRSRRRFVCCCCCCFPQQALSDTDFQRKAVFSDDLGHFFGLGSDFCLILSVSGPFS